MDLQVGPEIKYNEITSIMIISYIFWAYIYVRDFALLKFTKPYFLKDSGHCVVG